MPAYVPDSSLSGLDLSWSPASPPYNGDGLPHGQTAEVGLQTVSGAQRKPPLTVFLPVKPAPPCRAVRGRDRIVLG
jgi:hypothetical protein